MSEKKTKVVIVKDYPKRKITMGFLSVLVVLIVTTIFTAPAVLSGDIDNTLLMLTVSTLAFLAAVVIGIMYVMPREERSRWRDFIKLENFSWKWVGIGAGAGVLMTVLLQVIDWGIRAVLGTGIESSDTTVSLTSDFSLSGIIVMFIFVPFIAPIAEELFFRGFMMNSLREGFDGTGRQRAVFWSIFWSSLLFTILHFQGLSNLTDWFLLFWIFGISAVNAILVIKSDSLYTSIASHMVYNFTSVLLTLLIGA